MTTMTPPKGKTLSEAGLYAVGLARAIAQNNCELIDTMSTKLIEKIRVGVRWTDGIATMYYYNAAGQWTSREEAIADWIRHGKIKAVSKRMQ